MKVTLDETLNLSESQCPHLKLESTLQAVERAPQLRVTTAGNPAPGTLDTLKEEKPLYPRSPRIHRDKPWPPILLKLGETIQLSQSGFHPRRALENSCRQVPLLPRRRGCFQQEHSPFLWPMLHIQLPQTTVASPNWLSFRGQHPAGLPQRHRAP